MGNARKYFPLLAAAGLLASGAAQATLFDRGGGLLYDDVLKVSWLQDANYARTSGYDDDGLMNWADANAWATNLVYHDSVRGVDWSDWRLARNSPVGSNWNYGYSADGSTDYGYNITSLNSELAYMYHVNLGLKSYFSPVGTYQPDFGIFTNGTEGGQTDVAGVKNLRSAAYWSATVYAPNLSRDAWMFDAAKGAQANNLKSGMSYAWTVRDGDVAAVPEPESYALFLAGLAVMGGALRRRVRRAA